MEKISQHDPWYKCTLPLSALGVRLNLQIPHDVFSTMRIDEGTLLLLEHLPAHSPKRVLDLGCGYGALGLPIAAKFPEAKFELVDRDLLAATWAEINVRGNGLANVEVHGSLGFRDLSAANQPYDWILCNIPARIGKPFIEDFLTTGASLLAPSGELRMVVIRDLGPLIEEIRGETSLPIEEAARGPRHVIYALKAQAKAQSQGDEAEVQKALYLRDIVEIGGLSFERPFDHGGDDPKRLKSALPILLDTLPRSAPKRVLCLRAGYGQLPLVCRKRWPDSKIVAVDRDLLGTTFARNNALRLGLAGPQLEIREAPHLLAGLEKGERFDFAVGEVSASAGEKAACAEIEGLAAALAPGGEALLVMIEKLEKEWIKPLVARKKLPLDRMLVREGHVLYRLRPKS